MAGSQRRREFCRRCDPLRDPASRPTPYGLRVPETCIFCGRERGEAEMWPPEHWVSQWISRATIGPSQVVQIHDHGGNVSYSDIYDLTVARVCPECNSGWMSNFETRARRLALPLIKGTRIPTLPEQDQRLLSCWAYLKVITLEIGRPADQVRTYPEHLYRGFENSGTRQVGHVRCSSAGATFPRAMLSCGSGARERIAASQNWVTRRVTGRCWSSVIS